MNKNNEPEHLWELAMERDVGRPRIFETPDQLRDAATEYFEWAIRNPMKMPETEEVKAPRPLTIEGLTAFIGMHRVSWYDCKGRDEFHYICEVIEDVMFAHSYSAAAAGLLNHAIVARKLGLADKQEVTTSTAKTPLDAVHEADEGVRGDHHG